MARLCISPVALLAQADVSRFASFRVLAAVLLVVLICGLLYVLRHLKSFSAPQKGRASSYVIFVGCAVTFVVVCLLLYLVAKA